jgi:hypothetical protein
MRVYKKKELYTARTPSKVCISSINNMPNQKAMDLSIENKETLSAVHLKEQDTRETVEVSAIRSQCVRSNLGENCHRHMYNTIKRFITLP